jgi:hypothetical protein
MPADARHRPAQPPGTDYGGRGDDRWYVGRGDDHGYGDA